MLLPTAVMASRTCTNFSRLYQLMTPSLTSSQASIQPGPTPCPPPKGEENSLGDPPLNPPEGPSTLSDRCAKVQPFARPSGDLACGRHSSLSNRADAFNSVFERRRTGNAKRHRKEDRVRPRIWVHRRRRWQGILLPSEWCGHLAELRQPAWWRGRQLRHRAEPEGTTGESRPRRLAGARYSTGAPCGAPLFLWIGEKCWKIPGP